MRLFLFSFLVALFAAFALASAPTKQIVVTYEDPNTPQSVIDAAMQAIKDAGGVITHEYNLFKGFAAKASEKAIEVVKTAGDKYIPIIEDDIVYTTQDA
ncbi:hypothetical protein LTR66_015629 [Elasticomyces elasticus]|nr:hypothetical protein LTR66_015629 [Elasticomyces elasticus]